MEIKNDEVVEKLNSNPLFKLLDEERLDELAAVSRSASLRSGQVIYDTGDSCNGFFVILSGRVVIEQETKAGVFPFAFLEPGDHFGQEILSDSSRKRLTRATAFTDVVLVKFSRTALKDLASRSQDFKQAAKLLHRSFLVSIRKVFPWKNEHENIIYITRKHYYYLFRSLVFPVLTGILLLIPLALIYFVILPGRVIIPILMACELVVSFFWSLWKGWDWTNDYYVITTDRLLNLEKVVLFYESRQETPMEAVLSLETDSSFTGRWMGFGTIRAKTYTGSISFPYLESPDWVVGLLQDHWARVKTARIEVNQTEIEADIRQRISGSKPTAPQLPVNPLTSQVESSPLVSSMADLFKLKEIQDDSVIYRTHWWILVRRLFLPLIFLIIWLMSMIAAATGFLGGVDITFFFSTILLSGLVLWIWFLYRIVDWRNDYYMITPDQIIDVHRRPLGSEDKRTAPLKNIQTIEYKRLGMLGLLLNFGTVFIRIGDTEFTFDYVSDPSAVQKELFERFMDLTRKEKKNEIQAERERIADYIDTYHRMTGENSPGQTQTIPGNDSG
jgi:hypothetical protein